MRYLKTQVLNRRAPYDQRLQIDSSNNILMSSPAAVQVPAGNTAARPITAKRYGTSSTTDLSGMVRYNTELDQLEGYQQGKWRSFRFKEAGKITQQNLGAGDGSTVYFGPLTTYTPTNISSEVTNYGPQNLIVIVENVIQVPTTNYTIATDPIVAAETYTGTLSLAAGSGNTTLYFNSHLRAVSATCSSTTVTITFAAQAVTSFASGSTVSVTGFTPSGYNGTYVLTSVSSNTVSYTVPSTLATATIVGEVTSSAVIYPAVDITNAVVSGSASIQSSTTVVSYTVEPMNGALLSLTINKPLTGTISTSTTISIAESGQSRTGYYLKFSAPVPLGKPVTVLGGFDN